jgi:hypothetical protein
LDQVFSGLALPKVPKKSILIIFVKMKIKGSKRNVKQESNVVQTISTETSTYNPIFLVLFFGLAVTVVLFVFSNFPPLEPYVCTFTNLISNSDQKQKIKLPRSVDDVKEIGKVLSLFTDTYYSTVLLGYSTVYVLYCSQLNFNNRL